MVAFRGLTVACLVSVLVSSVQAVIFQEASQLPRGKTYDYIVVGAGAGGSVLANRLTEDPQTHVLLIEAGSSDFNNLNIEVPQFAPRLANSQFDWNFTTVNQTGLNGRVIPYTRGHVLGGSTSVNFMAHCKGTKDDYDRWAKVLGDDGWSWKSLQPFMLKMENFVLPIDGRNISAETNQSVHGHSGNVHVSVSGSLLATDSRVLNATLENPDNFTFNLDYNSGNSIGIGWAQYTIADGMRQNAAVSYLQPIFGRSNLDILVNTQVTKVLQTGTSGKTPEFKGVQFASSSSGPVFTLQAKQELILSAGSVKTPHLLMLSGIGDPSELSKFKIKTIVESPDVGKNLQDHPLVTSSWTVNSTDTLDNLNNATFAAQQLALWEKNHTGEMGLGAANQFGWLRLPKNASIFETIPDPSAGPTSAHHEFIFTDAFINFFIPPPANQNFFTAFTVVVSPTARGNITLASANPFDAPVINPGMLGTEFDIFTMRESIKSVRRFMQTPAWNGWILEEFGAFALAQTDDEIEQYARNNTDTINHVSGTAAMGKVLNTDLTVKGTSGLRVVDASAFPFIPAAHTQTPTYILAERGADLIKAAALANKSHK